jgi:hypothetical protein
MSSSTPPSHGATTPTQYTDKEEGGHYHCNHPHHYYEGRNNNVQKPHQSMVSQVYNPSFFKVANPGPLGLISFALTTFVLGLYQCGAG